MAGLVPRYTAEEVRAFDDPRVRFEVIRGELFVTPSPTKRTDRLQKRELYMDHAVGEYWIVDPTQRRVERWVPGRERPEVLTTCLRWEVREGLPAFELDLVALFARIDHGLGRSWACFRD